MTVITTDAIQGLFFQSVQGMTMRTLAKSLTKDMAQERKQRPATPPAYAAYDRW
ncbi:hypothetical protein HYU19_02170 [Candidatus Woesearchaeota archaeon]|nr:hypothetical protein [Candidatus Woesearchaeota archaeon]